MRREDPLHRWFVTEVLPLERELERFIARHCRERDELVDLRQVCYERALEGAARALPQSSRAYLFTIARNVLIDRARRAKVVAFEQIAELDATWDGDIGATERAMSAREDLRRALIGLEQLPPRCRDVVRLRKVDGLDIRETAERLGVSRHTVERQLTLGLRAMANYMLGGDGRITRKATATNRRKVKP